MRNTLLILASCILAGCQTIAYQAAPRNSLNRKYATDPHTGNMVYLGDAKEGDLRKNDQGQTMQAGPLPAPWSK